MDWLKTMMIINFSTTKKKDLVKRGCSDFFTPEFFINQGTNFFIAVEEFYSQKVFQVYSKAFRNKQFGQQIGTNILNLESVKNLLTFPHAYLQEIYDNYQNYSGQSLSKSIHLIYKKALKDNDRIKNAKSVEEKFKAFIEVNDDTVIIQNVELMIAKDPCNKWLWKSYLEFLKHRQLKAYLETFNKYTRFFLNDKIMKQKYEKELHRLYYTREYQNAPTLESFRFQSLEIKLLPQKPLDKLNPIFYKAFEIYIKQKFTFPPPLIWNILKYANVYLLRTLFESCKHLFLLRPTPICHNFKHGHGFSIKGQTLTISHRKQIPKEMKKLFITNIISISTNKSSTILSLLIPNIAESHARFINLKGQNLSWNEFRFLTNPQKVKVFYFKDGRITNALGLIASITEVIGRIPIAKKISVTGLKSTETTSAELAALKRRVKLGVFNIGEVNENFNYYDFEKFTKSNACQVNPNFTIHYDYTVPIDLVNNFNNLIFENRLTYNFVNAKFEATIPFIMGN